MLGPSTTNSHNYLSSRNSLSRSSTLNQGFNTTSDMIEVEDDENQIQQNIDSNNEDLPLKGLVIWNNWNILKEFRWYMWRYLRME